LAYAEASKLFRGRSLRIRLRIKKPVVKRTRSRTKRKPSAITSDVKVQIRRRINELGLNREQGFHYPQGVHIGHLLAILHGFGKGGRRPSEFHTNYIRLHGGLGTDRIAVYRRQLKYKLLAAIGFGMIAPTTAGNDVELTPKGEQLRDALLKFLKGLDVRFQSGSGGIPSTRMKLSPKEYNQRMRNFLADHTDARRLF